MTSSSALIGFMEMAANLRGVETRAEINVSEFFGALKKLSSDKVTERKVPCTVILCCPTPSPVEAH